MCLCLKKQLMEQSKELVGDPLYTCFQQVGSSSVQFASMKDWCEVAAADSRKRVPQISCHLIPHVICHRCNPHHLTQWISSLPYLPVIYPGICPQRKPFSAWFYSTAVLQRCQIQNLKASQVQRSLKCILPIHANVQTFSTCVFLIHLWSYSRCGTEWEGFLREDAKAPVELWIGQNHSIKYIKITCTYAHCGMQKEPVNSQCMKEKLFISQLKAYL